MDQTGADLIFRASYLLTNFKLGFIQGRDERSESKGRPCKCEIRYHGATDDGLVDIRPDVEMWGNDAEVQRWNELRNSPQYENLSDTDISELVLKEDWPSKLRKKDVEDVEKMLS